MKMQALPLCLPITAAGLEVAHKSGLALFTEGNKYYKMQIF